MIFNCYETNPQRFNPQFIGIASSYAQHKKKRLTIEKRSKELDSDYQYTINIDSNLGKSLQNKTVELLKLQKARKRHIEQIRRKQQLGETRRIELSHLRQRNHSHRLTLKKNVEKAKTDVFHRKKESRSKIIYDLCKLNQTFEKYMENRQIMNMSMYHSIKDEKTIGKRKVDQFHRMKNQESLQFYRNRIEGEHNLKREIQKKIRKCEKDLITVSKTVQLKKNYLNEIQEQILKYRSGLKTVNQSSRTRISKRMTEERENDSYMGKSGDEFNTLQANLY